MRQNPRRGGAIAAILLTILILGVFGMATLVCTGLYFARHVRVTDTARGETTVETPFGSVKVRESEHFDPRHLGVPVYPGAVRQYDSNKLASFHIDFGDVHKGFAVSAAEYRTSDPIERVTEFYRSELPHWLVSEKENGGFQLSFTRHGYKRLVAICEQDGETHIALASIGEAASN